jgi:hypothetical protein
VLLWLGLSGGAVLLQRITGEGGSHAPDQPAASLRFNEEEDYVVLREDAATAWRNEPGQPQ